MSVKPRDSGETGAKKPGAKPRPAPPDPRSPDRADPGRELQHREFELKALHAVQDAVAHSLELKDVLNQALEAILAVSGMEAGEILLWDPTRQVLDIAAWRGVPTEYADGMTGLKPGESVSGYVFQTGEPYVVSDVRADPRVTREVSRRVSEYRAGGSFPLRVKGRMLGTLGIGMHTPRTFSPQEVRLLQTVADQAAVAIDNAELYEAQQKYARRLMRLSQSTLPVLTIFPVETLSRRIVESALELLHADLVALPIIEADGRSFTYVEAAGAGSEQVIGKTFLLDEGGLCGWVAAHSRPLLVTEVKEDPRVRQDLADALGIRSALVVPLTRGGRTLGGLSAFRLRTAFSELDQQVFELFANYATASLENARLFERLQRNAGEQAALLELSATYLQSGDPHAVAERAAQLSQSLLQVEACAVMLPEAGTESLVPLAAVGYPTHPEPLRFGMGRKSQAGYAIRQNLPIASHDLRTEKRFEVAPMVRELGFATGLAVPMRLVATEGGADQPPPAGAMIVHSRAPRLYTDNDIRLLSLIANQVATSVQASQLLNAREEAQQKFRSLVESVPGVVWEMDPATRRITYMSPQVEGLTGHPPPATLWGRRISWMSSIPMTWPVPKRLSLRFEKAASSPARNSGSAMPTGITSGSADTGASAGIPPGKPSLCAA